MPDLQILKLPAYDECWPAGVPRLPLVFIPAWLRPWGKWTVGGRLKKLETAISWGVGKSVPFIVLCEGRIVYANQQAVDRGIKADA